MEEQNIQLDPDAVNLAKAIRQTESGGDFNAKGKSGEYGAYQFTEPTWKAYAKKHLGQDIPLAQATPEDQNQVAYKQIKEWKDKGYNVGQIASMWNAGENRPDAYLENHTGINKYGVHYDTPKYAKSVATAYQTIKNGGVASIDPNNPSSVVNKQQTPEQPSQSLGEELANRINDASTGISSLIGGEKATGQSRFSGALQTVGAIAGGVGDIIGKGLELIPGVKGLEKWVGGKISDYAQTEGGQAVVNSIKEFSTKHPELSKDIGAGFNIVTAIPILKGLGTLKNVALDSASQVLKNKAEQVALKDFTSTIEKTSTGRTFLQRNPNAVKTMIDERTLPTIENGKYSSKEAYNNLSKQISDIEDNQLQPALQKASTQGVQTSYVPLESYRKEAIMEAQNALKDPKPVEAYFDRLKLKYGEYPTIADLNEAKRLVRKNISEAGFASPTVSTDKIVGNTLQKAVEEGAKALGFGDVAEINQQMARLIKAQDLLKYLHGKPVKTGLIGETIKNSATVGGEALGNATGVPFAGAYIGRGLGGKVGKNVTGITQKILNRTGKNATKTSGKKAIKRSVGLLGASMAQNANQ